VKRIHVAALLACVACAGAPTALRAQSETPAAATAAAPNATPSLDDALHKYRLGQFDAAAQEYQALTTGPQAGLAYAGLARSDLRLRNPTDAYAAASKAVEVAPRAPDTQVALGEVYFRQGKIADAEDIFVKVINGGAEDARAYLGLAHVSAAAALYAREKTMLDQAHALDPSDPDIQRAWLGMMTLGDRIKALHDRLANDKTLSASERDATERQIALLQNQPGPAVHACHMTSKVSSTQMRLKQMLYGSPTIRGYGLDVSLNGVTSHLRLNTSGNGILVDSKVAEKAGIKRLGDAPISGPGDHGPVAGYVGQVDTVRIGDLEFQDCRVQVIESRSALGEDGIIGGMVLSGFLVDLDMPNGKLTLSPLPARPDEAAPEEALQSGQETVPQFHDRYVAPEMESFTRVFRVGATLLMPTKLNDKESTLFVVGTGSDVNIISSEAAHEVTHVANDVRSHLKTLNGNIKDVSRGDYVTLTFGNFRQETFGMLSMDLKQRSDDLGVEVSGILGFPVLRLFEMKIDYRDNLIGLSYNENQVR